VLLRYVAPQTVMSPAGAMQPISPKMAVQFLNQGYIVPWYEELKTNP